ncbi:MAG: M48 family metalloprotease [Thermodesulfobacteriota bacterium]
MKTASILVLSAFLLAGCATPTTRYNQSDAKEVTEEQKKQQVIAIRTYQKHLARLMDVGYPILVKNRPLCEDQVRPSLGMNVKSKELYKEEFQAVYGEAYGLADRFRITLVPRGSSAHEAGLRVGDEILAANGKPLDAGDATAEKWAAAAGEYTMGTPVTFRLLRDGKEIEATATPKEICGYGIDLVAADAVNAMADGKNIILTYGMLRFVETDLELATVLSHELAHNIMAHREAALQNAKVGGAVGLVFDIAAAAFGVNTQGAFTRAGMNAGSRHKSQEFEMEADYVGLYLLAQAGYPVDGAPDFWRRMAAGHPESIEESLHGSHPSSAQRYTALEKTVAEINDKRAQGKPLQPEQRDIKPEPGETSAPAPSVNEITSR